MGSEEESERKAKHGEETEWNFIDIYFMEQYWCPEGTHARYKIKASMEDSKRMRAQAQKKRSTLCNSGGRHSPASWLDFFLLSLVSYMFDDNFISHFVSLCNFINSLAGIQFASITGWKRWKGDGGRRNVWIFIWIFGGIFPSIAVRDSSLRGGAQKYSISAMQMMLERFNSASRGHFFGEFSPLLVGIAA